MELTGNIIVVKEIMSGTSQTGNPWMKQEYVMEVPGQYPRHCVFTVFGEDKIKQLNIQNGEYLTVQFDIDAREYNGRWYNDIRAYNVLREQMLQSKRQHQIDNNPVPPFGEVQGDDSSVLPF